MRPRFSASNPPIAIDLRSLSPVDRVEEFSVKRDDLFRPFSSSPVNGGKVRQCLAFLSEMNPAGVVSGSSIHSPQAAIVSSCAHYLGIKCVIYVGGHRETRTIGVARRLMADIRYCRSGRHTVLFHHARLAAGRERLLLVPYGLGSTGSHATIDATASQVQNLPDSMKLLVLACGSGMTAAGVLTGLVRFEKAVDEVLLIGTAPGRLRLLHSVEQSLAGQLHGGPLPWRRLTYENLYSMPGFRYDRREPLALSGIDLHPQYEAKVFRFSQDRLRKAGRGGVFWIVGADLGPDS